jgi:hypothetical protein
MTLRTKSVVEERIPRPSLPHTRELVGLACSLVLVSECSLPVVHRINPL